MSFRGRQLSVREWMLVAAAFWTCLTVFIVMQWIGPRLDQWQTLRARVAVQEPELAQLHRNLARRETIERQFATLDEAVFQAASDEVTLNRFLQGLESAARQPSLTLVNITPGERETSGAARQFAVRVSVSGTAADVLRFVREMTTGPAVVGIDSISLRGAQRGRRVECTLGIRLAQLLRDEDDPLVAEDR